MYTSPVALAYFINEISLNEVVVPADAAAVIIYEIISISWDSIYAAT
jgi:hypothetical protein